MRTKYKPMFTANIVSSSYALLVRINNEAINNEAINNEYRYRI